MKQTKTTEYTVEEMKNLLDSVSGMYDLARVVDPIECRILEFHDDGRVGMSDGCYGIWNAERKCMNCSSAIACRTGCHQEKKEYYQDKVFNIQSNPVKLKLPDGGTYDAVVELVNVRDEQPEDRQINDREAENRSHRAVEYRADHDSLTGALEADAFYEMCRSRIKGRPQGSWVMITGDIMDFRLVNTLFGIQTGNEVLVRTAEALRRIAEEAEGLCGRLGGDRFALLLPQRQYRRELLEETAEELAKTFRSGLYTFRIHFGVYRVEDDDLPVSVMCDRANAALRTIRKDLRRVVAGFDGDLMRQRLFEQEIISGFEAALEGGRFRMYLQPLVGENGEYYGAEALVRWQRLESETVMPARFISVLERAGLIHELDMYIWEQAVERLSLWKGTELDDLTISVNMSAKDFYSIDVYETLTHLVERYGVDSSKLRLEITETALLDEPEKSARVIAMLRARGFLVEIDDFGKGYSSLSMIRDIHADILKIDMTFVKEITCSDRNRIVLQSVIDMAESLGMDVIAEGVETEEQRDALAAMGCRRFQGYFFSPPIPVDRFEKQVVRAKRNV